MAEKVTGVIGQEDVTLENAATEATLLKLLKAMGSKGDGGSKSGGEESKKQLAALAKQSGKTTKELGELEEAADNVGNVYIRGIGQIANAFKGLTGELLTGGDRISDFTSHVTGALESIPIVGGLIGGIGQLLVSTIDNQIDTFRDLSKVGIDFGENLYEASYMATKTSLGTIHDTLVAQIVHKAHALSATMAMLLPASILKLDPSHLNFLIFTFLVICTILFHTI